MTQQRMMDETQKLNILFGYLYRYKTAQFKSAALEDIFVSANEGRINCQRPLEHLYSDGYVNTRNVEAIGALQPAYTIYYISSKGVHFIDGLPTEFKEKPYTYHLLLEKEKREKEIVRDDLDNKVKALTISSVKTQKIISYFSLGIAALSIITTFIVSMGTTKVVTTLQSMPRLLQTQEKITETLQQIHQAIDSLSNRH